MIEENFGRARLDLHIFMLFNILAGQTRAADYGWVSWSV